MDERQPFDAASRTRKIRTKQGLVDYLDVKHRVMWLRHDFPDAQIITDVIHADEKWAVIRCVINLTNGAIACGIGSETYEDFPSGHIEKAETKAIGRACAALGYGTDAASDFDDGVPMDGAGAAKGEADRKLDTPQAPRRMEPEQRQQVEAQHQRNTQPAPSNLPTTRQRPQPDGQDRARAAVAEKCAAKGVPVLPDDDYAAIAESVNMALNRAGSGVEVARNPDGTATAGAILNALMALPAPAAAR